MLQVPGIAYDKVTWNLDDDRLLLTVHLPTGVEGITDPTKNSPRIETARLQGHLLFEYQLDSRSTRDKEKITLFPDGKTPPPENFSGELLITIPPAAK